MRIQLVAVKSTTKVLNIRCCKAKHAALLSLEIGS